MIHRVQALALLVLMALATSLQGTAVMQCLCSGRVVLAGFGKTDCPAKEDPAAPHCPNCARKAAQTASSTLCAIGCWRVVDFGAQQPQLTSAALELPAPAPLEAPENASASAPVVPLALAHREPRAYRPPDPPGPPLTILYASLLL